MFSFFKKKSAEEKLEPVDVKAVSPLLLPPDPPEEEKLAYHPENTILTEDIAMNRSIASGAGTSGGFGAYQPFLSENEIEDREHPEAWQHDAPFNTDAPQRDVVIDRVERDEVENQEVRKAS